MSHDDGTSLVFDIDKSNNNSGRNKQNKQNTHLQFILLIEVIKFLIFIITNKNIPLSLLKTQKPLSIGLVCDARRLSDVRRNRIQSMHEEDL